MVHYQTRKRSMSAEPDSSEIKPSATRTLSSREMKGKRLSQTSMPRPPASWARHTALSAHLWQRSPIWLTMLQTPVYSCPLSKNLSKRMPPSSFPDLCNNKSCSNKSKSAQKLWCTTSARIRAVLESTSSPDGARPSRFQQRMTFTGSTWQN